MDARKHFRHRETKETKKNDRKPTISIITSSMNGFYNAKVKDYEIWHRKNKIQQYAVYKEDTLDSCMKTLRANDWKNIILCKEKW